MLPFNLQAPNKMEWNRIDSNLFASTHETQVLVWDIRVTVDRGRV